jgi:hypothetical protein
MKLNNESVTIELKNGIFPSKWRQLFLTSPSP